MRGLTRQKQTMYYATLTEEHHGIDTVPKYSPVSAIKLSVSATAGTPEELAAGIAPDYDRYITSLDRGFCEVAEEGMVLWVDRAPELDGDNNLIVSDDGVPPTTPPDYVLKKILDTAKGNVARYGIKKIGGE